MPQWNSYAFCYDLECFFDGHVRCDHFNMEASQALVELSKTVKDLEDRNSLLNAQNRALSDQNQALKELLKKLWWFRNR